MMDPEKLGGMCTKCGKAEAVVENGAQRLCMDCGVEMSKELFKLHGMGARVIDEAPQGHDGANLIPFPQQPLNLVKDGEPVKLTAQIVGADLVFRYSDNNARLVRITGDEQKAIIEKIVENRRTGKKDFQFMPVALISMDAFRFIMDTLEHVTELDVEDVTGSDLETIIEHATEILENLKK